MTPRRAQEPEKDISYFLSHTPPPSPPNTTPVSFLRDMISYNIQPDRTVSVNYQVGAENTYSFAFTIKNLTTNVSISTFIETHGFWTTNSYKVILDPLQQQTITLSLNKERLNSSAGIVELLSHINVTVTNAAIAMQALRSTTTSLVNEFILPNPIEVS